MDNARAFAQHLAEQGWCIVSGLALGIDTAAHEGALRAGPNRGGTVAIMGTGIDIVYPARNRDLAHRSEEHTSELQSLMRISYAVFCLKKKTNKASHNTRNNTTTHNKTTLLQNHTYTDK